MGPTGKCVHQIVLSTVPHHLEFRAEFSLLQHCAVVLTLLELCNSRAHHHVSLMGPDPSGAWHRMPRKILHPMPRKSANRDFHISENPDFLRFGSPDI